MIGPSLLHRLLVGCITVLVAALALQWATDILREIWPTLAVVAAVVVVVWGTLKLVRSHRNRW